jgi:myo-inositol 2-dehydrogenase / D-chiro-inositol 1-dehydrogenase
MSSNLLNIAVIGAGRIGKIHAENIATRVPGARLAGVADIDVAAARALVSHVRTGSARAEYQSWLEDPAVQAVAVCSATNTHADIIEQAAARGKHIFCEKPVDLDLSRIRRALDAVQKAGVKFQVGFNRRFDPSFAKVREIMAAGGIGTLQVLRVTSRDPGPPPISYVRVSGGIFLDMTIHDFDMTRFLSGSEVEDVYAIGDSLVDPEIGRAGDVDTCLVTMRLKNGVLATIDNSRKAIYGYDQRVEAFGSGGMVTVSNRTPENHIHLDAYGIHSAKPQHFFLDRYQESYVLEMQHFVESVLNDRQPSVSGEDGLAPVIIGLAAKKSLLERRPVRVTEVQG